MKAAFVIASLIVVCAAYWPQEGFDTANSYTAVPFDNKTSSSPLSAVSGGISSLSLVYSLAASPESVSVSSTGVAYIPVSITDLHNRGYIQSFDLATHNYTWFVNVVKTGFIPNNTGFEPTLSYTALHEQSKTLFVPVAMGNDTYFLGLDMDTGIHRWHAHWPCNLTSAPRVFSSGVVAIMCDNVLHNIIIPVLNSTAVLNTTHIEPTNVTTWALPEIFSPYELVSADNKTIYAISFDKAACKLNFNELTIPHANITKTTDVLLGAGCSLQTAKSCIAIGEENFACGNYLINLARANETVANVHTLVARTPAGDFIGHTNETTVVTLVRLSSDLGTVFWATTLPEVSNSNAAVRSMFVTVDYPSELVLVSVAADVTANNTVARHVYIFALHLSNGTIAHFSKSNGRGMPSWASVQAGPLVPTGTGSLIMLSRNTSSLYEYTCCSGNGECIANGTCNCEANYYNEDCSTYCEDSKCGQGRCAADGSCACFANYYGESCETKCIANETCSSHGTCDPFSGLCICEANYVSDLVHECSTFCNANVSCNAHGRCQFLTNTSVGCACDENYFSSNCTLFCSNNETCSSHGVCRLYENATSTTCECAAGWDHKSDCSVYCVANETCHGAGHCNDDGSCACDDSSMFGFVNRGCERTFPLSDWALIGIIIAAAVVLLAIIIALICCCKRRDPGYTAIRNEGVRNTGN